LWLPWRQNRIRSASWPANKQQISAGTKGRVLLENGDDDRGGVVIFYVFTTNRL